MRGTGDIVVNRIDLAHHRALRLQREKHETANYTVNYFIT